MLSPQNMAQYQASGLTYPLRVMTADEASTFHQACDALEAQLGGRPRTVEVRQMHLHFRWAYDLVRHPRILEAVTDLLGPDLLVWATELFAKHPDDSSTFIRWHRDRSYTGFDSRVSTTAWIALSESTTANGCMRAVSDPQRREAQSLSVDEAGVLDVELHAGEMSLHDSDILHGSGPNLSACKRVGFAIRYITPHARPVGDATPVLLVQGRDTVGHFPLAEIPSHESADSLTAMNRSARLHLDSILQKLRHAESDAGK